MEVMENKTENAIRQRHTETLYTESDEQWVMKDLGKVLELRTKI